MQTSTSGWCASFNNFQLKLPLNGINGRTDGRTGRLIPNFFRVIQMLLNIAVKVSLKDYWHLPKEVDYSLTFFVFVLGQSLTLLMPLCILNDPVIQRWSCIFVHPPVLAMSWSVVIVLIWTDVVSPPRRDSTFIYPQSDLEEILVVLWTIILLSKVKFCKSCL